MSTMASQPTKYLAAREQSYLTAIENAVRSVAEYFRREPASFLYEADLRGLLFARVFDALADSPQPITMTKAFGTPLAGCELRINPVKSETDARNRRRFDVAVISPEPHICTLNAWTLPVCAAIEVKFWQAGEDPSGMAKDLKKLDAYAAEAAQETRPFTGLALVFSHRSCDLDLLGDARIAMCGADPSAFRLPAHQVSGLVVCSSPARGGSLQA